MLSNTCLFNGISQSKVKCYHFIKHYLCLSILLVFILNSTYSQSLERPFIWVNQSNKQEILSKIKNEAWVNQYYQSFKKRIDSDLISYQNDKDLFLRVLPFDLKMAKSLTTPPFIKRKADTKEDYSNSAIYMSYLQMGIDCGVMYYLTNDVKYAQCASDILQTYVSGLSQLEINPNSLNGGLLYLNDHLREAREIGAQLPIIYDFIYPFIKNGGKVYDLGTKTNIQFSIDKAQGVFRTYIDLALNHGLINCNWPVLESPSLVQNILALDNTQERDSLLKYYLVKNTNHQDGLVKIAQTFADNNGIWNETTTYNETVSDYTTYLITLLTRNYPQLELEKKYSDIPLSLSSLQYYKNPNGEFIGFGDGKRIGKINYKSYEYAYLLGKISSDKKLTNRFGELLKAAIEDKEYLREELGERNFLPTIYRSPLALLWYSPKIEEKAQRITQPRTGEVKHAGIYLQRNINTKDPVKNGLMAFVGGGHYVHGTASGMYMELYGKGQILGTYNGLSPYSTEITQNYAKLFAAHNTVIVNGSSQSSGGWINLGINQVQKVAIEPEPFKEAVSPNYSFSTTSFVDDRTGKNYSSVDFTQKKQDGIDSSKVILIADSLIAKQERTLSVIRTSDSTGYYIDIFRSKTPQENQYHDYLYHNISTELSFLTEDKNFILKKDAQRFKSEAKDKPWVLNKNFRHPGWHYFNDVESSNVYSKNVAAIFRSKFAENQEINMKLFVPGFESREYVKVMAPATNQAPAPYLNKPTPTLVIRKNGEAWDNPFVVVYEPISGNNDNGSITSVEKLLDNGLFKGLIIKSVIGNKEIIQYVITQEANQTFYSEKLGINFTGSFAIITLQQQKLKDIYIGEGSSLSYQKNKIKVDSGKNTSAYINYEGSKPSIRSNSAIKVER
jgi:hypothetical protein